MKQGDLVIVRAFRHRPLLRVIWEENQAGVLVSRREEHERAMQRGEDANCSAFPKEDVFRYDPELWHRLEAAFNEGDGNQLEKLWAGVAVLAH
jgi:hypothetical protein